MQSDLKQRLSIIETLIKIFHFENQHRNTYRSNKLKMQKINKKKITENVQLFLFFSTKIIDEMSEIFVIILKGLLKKRLKVQKSQSWWATCSCSSSFKIKINKL